MKSTKQSVAAVVSASCLLLLAGACGGDGVTSTSNPPGSEVPPSKPYACPPPTLDQGAPGDNTSDARSGTTAPLFQRIVAAPFTRPENPAEEGKASDGLALVDIDGDGDTDIVAARNRSAGGNGTLILYENQGCMSFVRKELTLSPPPPGRVDVPTFGDFNGDGLADFYIGTSGPQGKSLLYLGKSATSFVDVAEAMGVQNVGAYNHGHATVADFDGDGNLDLLVGANQIGNPSAGRALKRLYMYRPPTSGPWEAGKFEDISTTTELVPGFMRKGAKTVTASSCDADIERSGALVLARDLDDDGDLDLLNGSSNDMFGGSIKKPCPTGEWNYGVYAWENRLAQGEFRLQPLDEAPGSLADYGRMKFSAALSRYEVDPAGSGSAFGPLSMNAADVDNDGDLDILGLTPTDPSWHVQSDMLAGRFWRNEGALRFTESTESAGLGALNWTYERWAAAWTVPAPGFDSQESKSLVQAACRVSDATAACRTMAPSDYQMMLGGGSVFADFDNDGYLDLLVVDRHDAPLEVLRNLVFMNRGDGTFAPQPAEISGMDATGISADARDLDGDGLLDVIVAERADNLSQNGYPVNDKIFRNSGALGGKDNHWLEVRIVGAPAEAYGTRIFARTPDGRSLGRRDVFPSAGSYKTSQDLVVHFGLGKALEADLRILPYAKGRASTERTVRLPADRRVAYDVSAGTWTVLP